MNHSRKVKQYYENNTRRFLWFHPDSSTKSIHQPLWKEAHFTQEEAFFYSNKLVLEEIENHNAKSSLTIIDLGCGVGSSIFYIQKQLRKPAIYLGVTISPTQVAIANKRVKKFNLSEEISFIEADFTDLPEDIPNIDIAFSIEAFAHASDAKKYFEQISRKLKKGGKIVLVDDFFNDDTPFDALDHKSKKAVKDFKYGWLVNSLKTPKELSRINEKFGLKIIKETNLTPYMRNDTLKHKWIWFLVFIFRWLYELLPCKSYYFRSWIGGQAKQYCLKKGIIQYKQIIFQKTH